MAMTAGSVTVAADGTVTKSGLASSIYDEFVNNIFTETGCAIPTGAAGVQLKRAYGYFATHMATALVTYMTTNATAEVAGTVAGMQITTALGAPTAAHGAATIHLPIA